MDNQQRYLILEISDSDFDVTKNNPTDIKDYWVRKASRGILRNGDKIALLFVSKENYHKLPGGGVEGAETNEMAFIREIKEETGCECKIISGVNQNSVIVEIRAEFKLVQFSYIFLSEIVGAPGELNLDQGEIDEGFELRWVTPQEAWDLVSSDKPKNYEGKFIQKRDSAVLNFYKDELNITV